MIKFQVTMCRLILVMIVSAIPINQTNAQMAAPEPINTPLKNEWVEPFNGFLRELGVTHSETMLAHIKALQIGGVWHPNSILFRIENPTTCHLDLCLTGIGHIADHKFYSDTMFTAGKNFHRSDHATPLFGFHVFQAWLESDRTTVTLLETPGGWIIDMIPKPAP